MQKPSRHSFLVYLKGMAMGAADVVPGVSGGTVAFITGIYDELINSLRAFDLQALSLFLKGQWLSLWQHINGSFLLALLLGIATSILSLARLISAGLEQQPVLVNAFFFGLIAASSLFIARQLSGWNGFRFLLLLLGMVVAMGLGELRPAQLSLETHWIFLAGALAICAMILPGISGSFILLLIGMYEPILNAIKSLEFSVLLIFVTGCACGLLAFVRLLSYLLTHYHDALLSLLTGILIGSLTIIWPWKLSGEGALLDYHSHNLQIDNVWPWEYAGVGDAQTLWAFGLTLVGLLLVWGLEKLALEK